MNINKYTKQILDMVKDATNEDQGDSTEKETELLFALSIGVSSFASLIDSAGHPMLLQYFIGQVEKNIKDFEAFLETKTEDEVNV